MLKAELQDDSKESQVIGVLEKDQTLDDENNDWIIFVID